MGSRCTAAPAALLLPRPPCTAPAWKEQPPPTPPPMQPSVAATHPHHTPTHPHPQAHPVPCSDAYNNTSLLYLLQQHLGAGDNTSTMLATPTLGSEHAKRQRLEEGGALAAEEPQQTRMATASDGPILYNPWMGGSRPSTAPAVRDDGRCVCLGDPANEIETSSH